MTGIFAAWKWRATYCPEEITQWNDCSANPQFYFLHLWNAEQDTHLTVECQAVKATINLQLQVSNHQQPPPACQGRPQQLQLTDLLNSLAWDHYVRYENYAKLIIFCKLHKLNAG